MKSIYYVSCAIHKGRGS